jgi:hypothetical protein
MRAGFLPFMIFFLMNGLFLMGYHQPGRKLGCRRAGLNGGSLHQGPADA